MLNLFVLTLGSHLNEDDVRQLIHDCSKKACNLDPLPTVALDYVDILLPVITKIINLSLISGQFAKERKSALTNPLLKKLGLDLFLQTTGLLAIYNTSPN